MVGSSVGKGGGLIENGVQAQLLEAVWEKGEDFIENRVGV